MTITGTVINKPAQGVTPIDGLAPIQITSAVTGQAGHYRYRITVTDAAGHPSTLRWGPLEIVST